MKIDLKEKSLEQLEDIVTTLGGKKYLAGYIFQFIHNRNVSDVADITPLSKTFREQLIQNGYYINQLKLEKKLVNKDGTIKYVFSSGENINIETVLLRDGKRKTLCISTQLGCAMDCKFCATAKIRFQRNLTAGEIIDQVNTVVGDIGDITNIVYMGMGEPLLNYEAVIKSLGILNHPKGKNIGIRHITISTCGITPAIRKLADEKLHPRLAVSLNAPTEQLRKKIMPITKKYPLDELLKAIKYYQDKTGRRVTFEYIMIQGLNDSNEQAKLLSRLIKSFLCHVNLIEHNPYPQCEYKGSGSDRIKEFASILQEAGIETTIRFRMGREIHAACGQLGADQKSK